MVGKKRGSVKPLGRTKILGIAAFMRTGIKITVWSVKSLIHTSLRRLLELIRDYEGWPGYG
jgi:hypothetical protein